MNYEFRKKTEEYLQEFKDLYTKEEYKELLALWREDYNKYLRGLICEN